MFEKLLFVVAHNIGFWVMIISSIVFGILIKVINKKAVVWWEALAQIGASCLAIFLLFMIFYDTTSGIKDFDIWNSYVTSAEYYEAWTEECTREVCTGSGKDRSCHTETYNVYHPPYWQLLNAIGEVIGIEKAEYKKYVNLYKNEKKKNLYHMNQVSFGDGDMYYSLYPNTTTTLIPTAVQHSVVNYLKGSTSIKKRIGNTKGYEKLLLEHPRVFNAGMGHIELNRVLTAGLTVPKEWVFEADRVLDVSMAELGPKKQVNALIYIVNTKDPKFYYALEEAWVNAKKNEVVAVIGASEFPKIDWVNVMAWSKTEDFKIKLRDRLMALPDLSDPTLLSTTISNQIALPPAEGGFQRLRMRDLSYLVADITLPVWVQILIGVLGIAVNVGIAFFVVKNDVRG